MLTRDLLRYRVCAGEVRPQFIDAADPDLLRLAADLLEQAYTAAAQGRPQGEVDKAMADCRHPRVDTRVSAGLVKLVADLCTYAAPDETAPARRAVAFTQGSRVLRSLPPHADRAEFCARVAQVCGDTSGLYHDLPQERGLVAVKPFSAPALLERYNMAQVQGLVMAGARVHVRAFDGDLRAMRRVLRWLKFCRLVARVQQGEAGSHDLFITGPAEVFEHAKKYGLQLAMFLPVVPILPEYALTAEIALRPGTSWQLRLDHKAPLVSPYRKRPGALPPALQHIVKAFATGDWRIDTRPAPRPVGARDMMLPDFTCVHSAGARLDVELFHRWHRHALAGRIEQLRVRPDPEVVLGVEKSIANNAAVAAGLAALPAAQVFVFNEFPSVTKLTQVLATREA